MLVKVTEQHKKLGVKGKYSTCPVALAMNSQVLLPVNQYWKVFTEVFYLCEEDDRLKPFWIPDEVTEWIVKFDQGADPEPFEFEFDLIANVLK